MRIANYIERRDPGATGTGRHRGDGFRSSKLRVSEAVPSEKTSELRAELDPATDRFGLFDGDVLAAGHRFERVLEVGARDGLGVFFVVVNGAVVDELPGLVEEERLG